MVNHPNRRRTPFTVHLDKGGIARFIDADAAHEYAQFYSERYHFLIEVSLDPGPRYVAKIIGRYRNGLPTPEFASSEDAWFPAGPRS